MTRPQIIRADTIDLQDPDSPSAKDHTKQPTNPNALGDGPPAPHQAATLKSSGIEGLELHSRSPRASQDLSTKELQLLHDHNDADEAESAESDGIVGQRNGAEEGDVDEEGDESIEDDMMDKISSSPSIDDGGYRHDQTLRIPFRSPAGSSKHSHHSSSCSTCSSPYTATPEHLPLSYAPHEEARQSEVHHYHQGKYTVAQEFVRESLDGIPAEIPDSALNLPQKSSSDSMSDGFRSYLHDLAPAIIEGSNVKEETIMGTVFPLDDPLADHGFDFGFDAPKQEVSEIYEQQYAHELTDNQETQLPPRPLTPVSVEDVYEDDSSSEEDDDDDTEDSSFDDPRFTAFGWSVRCLRDTEDIDFEFVYALHTFVATVEGQANATKGDTMVLLDDSNSYWWLVRVVKDNSIGYLPAEHIETPTERLARLNKHRNIDLSQTMLGDNPEKFKNPLKKAMRRRNAKTVAFAEPTYFEASGNEYSSEEENEEDLDFITSAADVRNDSQTGQQIEPGVDIVEPLKFTTKENGKVEAQKPDTTISQVTENVKPQDDKSRDSSELADLQDENVARSNRRMRNTDSFFKDDSVEPRKINLTPSLLRDDSSAPSNNSIDQSRNRGSMETTPKPPVSEKPKEDKRKEKKSMLGGLFKRRERKSKTQTEDDDMDWLAKETGVSRQGSQSKVSSESIPSEPSSTPSSPQKNQPVRQTSKLQKNPPSKSNSFNRGSQKNIATDVVSAPPQVEAPQQVSPLTNPFDNIAGESIIADRSFIEQRFGPQINASASAPASEEPKPSSDSRSRNVFSPIRDVLRNPQPGAEPRPEKVKKATTRMALEDSDESQDEVLLKGHDLNVNQKEPKAPSPTHDNLSESPVHVTPVLSASQPPQATDSLSSQDEVVRAPDSPTSSPELVERPTEEAASGAEDTTATPTSTIQSSKRSNKPQFSWARCQRWFDEEFPTWYALIMDVSEEMKDFNWKEHWAYKEYCKDYFDAQEDIMKKLDEMQVDYWDQEMALAEGRPVQHPPFRIWQDEAWYEYSIRHHESQGKKKEDIFVPWLDPQYSYLFPHRPDRVQGPHVATGPPEGFIPRRKWGEPDPKYADMV